LDKSIALGFLPRDRLFEVTDFEIEILGERRRARRLNDPLFDPEGLRLRQ
jgi:dimethylglycine dehydrogenase